MQRLIWTFILVTIIVGIFFSPANPFPNPTQPSKKDKKLQIEQNIYDASKENSLQAGQNLANRLKDFNDTSHGDLLALTTEIKTLREDIKSALREDIKSALNEAVIKIKTTGLGAWAPILSGFAALVSGFAAVVSVVIASLAFRYSYYGVRYTYLANKWYDLKDKEFGNPDFADEKKTKDYGLQFSDDIRAKYEQFAWICWGHGEDIYLNRLHEDKGFSPTLKRYKRLHYQWLLNNKKHFDIEFVDYIASLNE